MMYKIGDLVSADNYWAVITDHYQNSQDFYWVDFLSIKPQKRKIMPAYSIKGCRADYCLDREYFQQLLGWAKLKHPDLDINFIQEPQ
jgi:hypothetical protein